MGSLLELLLQHCLKSVTAFREREAAKRRSWLMTLPLIVFLALAALFWLRLGDGDPSRIPSALIGHPAPQTSLPPLRGLINNGAQVPGLDPANFKGKVSVVNVWASWCVPCHDEAPLLTKLARDNRLQLVGINYKDATDNAQGFLSRYGNPFASIGVDGIGRASIEWGVYGVPETFIVGRNGKIVYKLIGPITPDNIDSVLKAEIDKAVSADSISQKL
jgi:cytochrome c biogenesis protein CcmG/thiol:disulfide interchange protein DsbE